MGMNSSQPDIKKRLRIKTTDDAVDLQNINTIQVTPGTLTDDGGGVATIQTGGGGGGGTISGAIAAPQVAYATGGNTIGGESGFEYDDVNDLLTVEKTKTQVVIEVQNGTSQVLQAGAPVYVSGAGSGGKPQVSQADSATESNMPSIGIVTNQISGVVGANGYVAISGQLNGLSNQNGDVFDSDVFSTDIGKTIYVGLASGSGPTRKAFLTLTKPDTLSNLYIQNVGRVLDAPVSPNTGNVKIQISNIGRYNDVPNTFSIVGDITTAADITSTAGNITSAGFVQANTYGNFGGGLHGGGSLTVTGQTQMDALIRSTRPLSNPDTLDTVTDFFGANVTPGATINLPTITSAIAGISFVVKDISGGGFSLTPNGAAGQKIEKGGGVPSGLGSSGAPYAAAGFEAVRVTAMENNWWLW